MKKAELEAECKRLQKELREAQAEAAICRECFSKLRDLVVANGRQVIPHLSAFQPLRATMESLAGMRDEIARRLEEVYGRQK